MKAFNKAGPECRADIEQRILGQTYGSLTPNSTESQHWLPAAISAQHHGAPTRLLDWSDSLLTAAYFATRPSVNNLDGTLTTSNVDANIWAIHICPEYEMFDMIKKFETISDFEEKIDKSVIGFYPPATTPRVLSQQSYFTLTKDPCFDLATLQQCNIITHIYQLTIPKGNVSAIQLELFRLGIRHKNLFPDLDGHNQSIWQDIEISDVLKCKCQVDTP